MLSGEKLTAVLTGNAIFAFLYLTSAVSLWWLALSLALSAFFLVFQVHPSDIDFALPEFDYQSGLLQNPYVPRPDPNVTHSDSRLPLEASIYPDRPDIRTVDGSIMEAVDRYRDLRCLGTRQLIGDHQYGPYEWLTYREVGERIVSFGRGLLASFPSLASGQLIGVFGVNCAELEISIFGILSQGCTVVPFYDSLMPDDISQIIASYGISIFITQPEKYQSIASKLPSSLSVVLLRASDVPDAVSHPFLLYDTVLARGRLSEKSLRRATEDDCAYILLTSGSTGKPRGVCLSHRSLLSIAIGLLDSAGPIVEGDTYLSFLPLAHGFEIAVHELKPTIFCGVPRVYEIIYGSILKEFRKKPILVQLIIDWSLKRQARLCRIGRRNRFLDALHGTELPLPVSQVFRKVQAALGGRIRIMCVGSSPMPDSLKEFLHVCFAVPIIEGYGLTECAAIMAVTRNDPRSYLYGNTGYPIYCCEVKIEPIPRLQGWSEDEGFLCAHSLHRLTLTKPLDCPENGSARREGQSEIGEICCRGPNVMMHYFREAPFAGEWLHSGDIGRINRDGTLTVLGRAGNVVKLSHGEYIPIESLELLFSQVPLISQVFICPNKANDALIAIVVPDKPNLKQAYHDDSRFNRLSFEGMCKAKEIAERIRDEMESFARAKGYKGFQIPKSVILEGEINALNQGFSTENNLLTPTFKFRRGKILDKYRSFLERL